MTTEAVPSLMVAFRLSGRAVLIVGGGPVAHDRLCAARAAGAEITVVAPALCPPLALAHRRGELAWQAMRWQEGLLDRLDGLPALVLVAVDEQAVSAQIAAACRARRVPVNVADEPDLCDFWFTSVHQAGEVQIAVSTGGAGPALARRLRQHLAACLPPEVPEALRRFGALRAALRDADPAPEARVRRMPWLSALGRTWRWPDLARLEIAPLLSAYQEGAPPPSPSAEGRLILIGAGPGDPGLLTVAGRAALETADLVLCDRLVPAEIRSLVRGELRIAGKHPGRAEAAQAELDGWVLEAARAGRVVARLKCGDPFLFGRGAEEVALARSAGIPVEVIPGVSSALAAPLLGDIPLTCRGLADRLVILTGQGEGGRAVAVPAFRADMTVIVLMAVGRLEGLVAALLAAGWPPDWPVATVERASQPGQRTLRASLQALPAAARSASLAAPAVVVVGRVAALAAEVPLRVAV